MSLYKVDFKPSALARSISKDTTNQHANPPGFNSNNGTKTTSEGSGGSGSGGTNDGKKGKPPIVPKRDEEKMRQFRIRNAYKFAQSSFSGVMMTGVMMWFTGNGIQIFSIMVTFNGLFQPIKAILTSGKTFERFGDKNTDVTTPRLMYCVIQLMGLALALRKLNARGLLPTHASDWLSGLKPPVFYERAYGGTEM